MPAVDYKKTEKHLYVPGLKPDMVNIPAMPFLMVDGSGAPEGREYQAAVGALYSVIWSIKMSKMNGPALPGYYDFVVPPLEGLWETPGGLAAENRGAWQWTSLLRVPDFVTHDVLDWALDAAAAKKPGHAYEKIRLSTFQEGLCVQCLHVGPYATEPATIEKLHAYIDENDLVNETCATRRHHELYLSDPGRTAPDKLRTVLRLPVRRK